MKSLKEYSLNISSDAYHALPAWSHSQISTYAQEGFSSVATIHEKTQSTPSMEFGSLFDCMVTQGQDTLNKYVIDTTELSIPPAEKEVFDRFIASGLGKYSFEDIWKEANIEALNIVNSCSTFCSKYKKDDTRFQKLFETKWYYELHRSGKKVVSRKDWDDAVEMLRALRSNKLTKDLFGSKNTSTTEYLYQTQFRTELTLDSGRKVEMRIMPDLLKIEHENKTVQPVDLKTSAMPGFDFKQNFLKYRYDIEAALYTDVLREIMDKDEDYKDYIILPFLFTDISRSDKVPVTYWYDPRSDSQRNGLCFGEEGKYKYKNWRVLLDEIISYEESQAKVPSWIDLDSPNDMVSILGMRV